ncbi:MAG TPA: DUF4350 domain-containing protein [Flavobacteriales bacterium]
MSRNKSNNTSLIAIIGVVIVAGVLLWLFTKSLNWNETYEADNKNPYGTKVLHDLLKASHKTQSFVYIEDSLKTRLPVEKTDKINTYFYVGNHHYTDSADVSTILEFVTNGNIAFIVGYPRYAIADSLLRIYSTHDIIEDSLSSHEIENNETVLHQDGNATDEDIEMDEQIWFFDEPSLSTHKTIYDTIAHLHVKSIRGTQQSVSIKKIYKGETLPNGWYFFKPHITTIDGDSIEVLGTFNNEYANFIRFKCGNGYIYLHCTPLAFTNYYMIEQEGMEYCREALSYLGDGTIYWDEDSRYYDYRSFNYLAPSSDKGPLEFILSEPALRKAWYLLLLTTLLFILFGAKRTQRIIPTMPKMDNTSIEYAEVISQMFMKQKDHKKLVTMKMDLFKAFLRERFRLKLSQQDDKYDDLLITDISQKSSVSKELVEDIFKQYNYLKALATVDTADMMKFHLQLERFYNTCK